MRTFISLAAAACVVFAFCCILHSFGYDAALLAKVGL